jgi:hypothetical protein
MKLFVLGALLLCSTSSKMMSNKKAHVTKSHSSSHKLSTISSTITPASFLEAMAEERVINKDWLPSVKALSVLIDEDPILRMNW